MADLEWQSNFKAALDQRYKWLSDEEIPKLKTAFKSFYASYSMLYGILVKQGVITADPYKNDSKIASLAPLETDAIPENAKQKQFGLRLSSFDNMLEYVANLFNFSVDILAQDKIKLLLALVKFIDWVHTTPDSTSYNTQTMSEIIARERHNPSAQVVSKNFNDCLKKLEQCTVEIMRLLKEISDYNREAFKGDVREKITANMTADNATLPNIKKSFAAIFKGRPFYAELIDELIAEDYSPNAAALQAAVLKKLAADTKPPSKTAEKISSFKPVLIEGLAALGGASATLEDMLVKVDSNHEVFQNKKKTFSVKVKEAFAKMFNKEPEPVVYICDVTDQAKGVTVKEKIVFASFHDEIERKCKVLRAVAPGGPAVSKLDGMKEEQIFDLLNTNIRDVQNYHRQFNALDDFFKTAPDDMKGKMKGIKPELSTLKNAIHKATSKKHDFLAMQEENEQFKKLGVDVEKK